MITFASQSYTKHPNPFWREEVKILPGGFKPVQDFPVGTKLYRGTFVSVLPGLTCAVIKMGKVVAGGTTTKPRVEKGSNFQVGDVVMDLANDSKSPTVSAIDTSNAEYDVLTLSAAITGLAANHLLQEANEYQAAGDGVEEVKASPKYVANAVLAEDKEFKAESFPTLDVAYSCVLLKDVIPAFPEGWLVDGGYVLKANPNIKVIEQ